MAADAKNRETMRDALAALLNTALTVSGNSVETVYGYKVSDFDKASPVVVVVSDGSDRDLQSMGTLKFDTTFHFVLFVFVADSSAGDSWTDQNVDDRLDLIEKDIADVVADNRKTADWAYLDYEGPKSEIGEVDVGGEPYVVEQIKVTIRAFD